jgi:hypothetical protein
VEGVAISMKNLHALPPRSDRFPMSRFFFSFLFAHSLPRSLATQRLTPQNLFYALFVDEDFFRVLSLSRLPVC